MFRLNISHLQGEYINKGILYSTVQYQLLIGIQPVSITEFVNKYQSVNFKIIKMLDICLTVHH